MIKKCKVCGKDFYASHGARLYCGLDCNPSFPHKNEKCREYNSEWQRNKRKKLAVEAPDKTQCKICGLWYKNLYQHVTLNHKISKEDYLKLNK